MWVSGAAYVKNGRHPPEPDEEHLANAEQRQYALSPGADR